MCVRRRNFQLLSIRLEVPPNAIRFQARVGGGSRNVMESQTVLGRTLPYVGGDPAIPARTFYIAAKELLSAP